MNTDIKPHGDSRLKSLPEERQDQIACHALDHTLAQTVDWLGSEGVATTSSTLSRFLTWYRLRQQIERNRLVAGELLAERAKNDPTLDAQQLQELGHVFFAGLTLEQQDPRTWCLIQQMALRKTQVDLEIQKYKDALQAHKEAVERTLKAAEASGGISPETLKKIEQELGLC